MGEPVQDIDPGALASVFESSPDGFFVMRLDTPLDWHTCDKDVAIEAALEACRITHVNHAMCEQYRGPRDALIGKSARMLFDHDPDQGRRVWRDFYDQGRLQVETHEKRLDGSSMWVAGDYLCLYDDRGRIVGHVGFQRDVSERKQTERYLWLQHRVATALNRLQDRSAIFDETLESLMEVEGLDAAAVYLFDATSGDLALVSCRGATDTEMAERKVYPAQGPYAALVGAGRSCFTTQASVLSEVGGTGTEQLAGAIGIVPIVDRHPIGCIEVTARSVETIPAPAQDCIRAIGAMAGAAVARAAAHESMQRGREDLAFLFDALDDGLFVLDERNAILHTNSTFQRLVGWDADDLVGLPVSQLHPPERAHEVAVVLGRMWSGAQSLCTVPLQPREGEPVAVETRVSRGRWAGQRVLFGITRDIRQRLADDVARERLAEQLRQAQKLEAVGRLAGGIAHEFNNLLAAIVGYCSLAAGKLRPADSEVIDDIQQVQRAAEAAKALVDRMLAFSRGAPNARRPLRLEDTVRDVARALDRKTCDNVRVEVGLPADPWLVTGDARQLAVVVMNLAKNACDAMPGGGVLRLGTTKVTLSLSEARQLGPLLPGRYVRVRVQDEGHGMDPEVLRRAFEPFFSTKGVGRGTGLGLASAYGIVRDHEGQIHCASNGDGGGTTFDVYLPAAPQSGEARRGPEGYTKRTTALVVDDEPKMRNVLTKLMTAEGFHVLESASAESALGVAELHDGRIDIALVDLGMPGRGGLHLIDELQERRPETAILVLTGYGDERLFAELRARGVKATLDKLCPNHLLISAVRQTCSALSHREDDVSG